MGDFRDREGFLSGSEEGKRALRSPSGGPFGCLREDFLGLWDVFLGVGWPFRGPMATF